MSRDGAALSATEALRRELSDADHLGVLSSIWYDLVRQAEASRYERLLRQHLPGAAEAAIADPACTWLWRTLREAETTGLDASDVLRSAIGGRSLRGARHVARVLDARIRRSIADAVPHPWGPWSRRVPVTGNADLDAFLAELAAAMDDRVQRIGDYVARLQPEWATGALGPLPDDPAQCAAWIRRAAQVGAYREMYGYNSPEDALGPEPSRASPEARAGWHTALAAAGGVTTGGMRDSNDELLRQVRAAYQRETSWAPPYVADALRSARMQERIAFENLTHKRREREIARDQEFGAQHDKAIAGLEEARREASSAVAELEQAQETRRQWEVITSPTRHRGLEADQELRRRHFSRDLEPLRSADAEGADPAADPGDQSACLGNDWADAGPGRLGLSAARPNSATQHSPPPTGTSSWGTEVAATALHLVEISRRVAMISDRVRKAGEVIDDLREMGVPSEESDVADLGLAWVTVAGRRNRALVQPASLDVAPASEVLRRAAERRSAVRFADSSPEAESA